MKINLFTRLVGVSVCCTVFLISCNNKNHTNIAQEVTSSKKITAVTVEAEKFTDASAKVKVLELNGENTIVKTEEAGWISFDVNVPIAGRYKSEIRVSHDLTNEIVICWIEDYYDNKDDRQYNITGSIEIPSNSEEFGIYGKDGSPLNSGLHRIKLHFDKGIKIDWIKFTLIKEHEITPLTLMQKTNGRNWKVVWSDEFDGEELDRTKWTYDIGNWGWGNGETQYYTVNNKNNARVENGNLIIEARKNVRGEWTSARLTTRGKVSFLYGKIEFRAKVPEHKGNWAAGWTLGDAYVDELSWPYCGEIDILESVGYEMDNTTGNGIAHASAHSAARYFKKGNQPTSTVDVSNMNDEFHTYAVEWMPEEIIVSVDGKPYFYYKDDGSELSWPFCDPHNIILNLTIGGGWGGYYGIDETINSQKMIVDYVRVYESK